MKKLLSVGLKGGVGKTTVAVGIAKALSRKGLKVGVLDLDYRTPNVLLALGGNSELGHQYEGDILIPPSINGIKAMSMAYIWPDWKCVLVEDKDAMEDVIHLLTPGIISWGDLDYLIIDTPPTSTGVVKVALESEGIMGAVIVSHASSFSKMDTVRTLDLFAEKEVPILGIVCNQSIGDDGENRYDLSPKDIQELSNKYKVNYLATIPHTKNLDPHFDALVQKVLSVSPSILKLNEPKEETWKKLLSLARNVSGSSSS